MDDEQEYCIYCGKPRHGYPYASCCGEMHYDTQENIDNNNREENPMNYNSKTQDNCL
jgi:hypothetical protein